MRRAAVLLLVACSCVGGGRDDVARPAPSELVREGARPATVRRGDLDGDGIRELIVASVSESPNTFGLPTPYLEVFAYRDEEWWRVFDASGHAPPGEGTPPAMLEAADEEFAVGQSVDVLEVADLEQDGASEMVVAVSNVGATAGPLELWIVGMSESGELRTEYYTRTERGGKVGVRGDRVAIEFGVYKKKDPGCCPSSFEVQTIGYDPEQGEITVLERERHPLNAP
ncbi:MAG: hypothetical protein ACRDH9_10670 [Actinomycetota bacterium]